MAPQHFWWLVETMEKDAPRKGLDAETRAELLAMLDEDE